MIEHPDFFNVRKMAIIFASGPLLLFMLIIASDFSWQQFRIRQFAQGCSRLDTSGSITKLDGNECRSYLQYRDQK